MRNFIHKSGGLGVIAFAISGILLLASLPPFVSGDISFWIAAKIFYLVGVALFLFDK